MGIVSTYINSFPMPLRGMADTESGVIVASLVDEPGFEVCACDRCEFEEYAFVKSDGDFSMNAKKRFIRSKIFASDTIEFTLWKNGVQVAALNSNTYGAFYNFGNADLINPYYKCFIIDWNTVQQALGYGKYTVKTTHTSLGVVRVFESWKFKVVEYTPERANGTVRIETYQNGVLMNGFDYTDIFLYQSLWIKGYFGDKIPKYTEDNYRDTNRKKHQIDAEIIYTYKLGTELLPAAVFNIINNDEILANDIYITDYNVYNQERYVRKNVYLTDIPSVENHNHTRVSSFVYEFTDKYERDRKRNISGDFGAMPLQPNSTSTATCADAILEVNGISFTTIPSGNTYDLVVKDDDGAVVGSKIGEEWIVPAVPALSGIYFKITKGTQYTSYQDEDDGWLIQNSFYNPFEPSSPALIAQLDLTAGSLYGLRMKDNMTVDGVSNNWRYVDRDGVQNFTGTGNKNLTFIDKLTGLEWYRNLVDTTSRDWLTQGAFARSHSITIDGELCNNWIMPTIQMLQVMIGSQAGLGITDNAVNIWLAPTYEIRSSTTYMANTLYAWVKYGGGNGYSSAFTASDKSVGLTTMMLCRKATNLISI